MRVDWLLGGGYKNAVRYTIGAVKYACVYPGLRSNISSVDIAMQPCRCWGSQVVIILVKLQYPPTAANYRAVQKVGLSHASVFLIAWRYTNAQWRNYELGAPRHNNCFTGADTP